MDLATLGLRVDASGAVIATKQLDTSLKDLGKTTEGIASPFDRMTKKIEESRLRYEAWQRQLARDTAMANQVTQINSMRAAHEGATLSAGRLRGGLSSLAAQVTGLNPQVSQLSSVLGSFALGSGPMVGILAGIAAISYAYNKLTEDTRKAKDETEHFLESLRRQAQAAKDASVSGSEARAEQARQLEADARAAQRRFNETGGGPSWQANLVTGRVTRATEDRILAEANAAKVLAAANEDIRRTGMQSDAAMAAFNKTTEHGTTVVRAHVAHLTELERALQKVADIALKGSYAGPTLDIVGNVNNDLRFDTYRGPQNPHAGPGGLTPLQAKATALEIADAAAKEKSIEATRKHAATMQIASGAIANAIATMTAKFGGTGIASSFGGGIGQAGASMLGGFGGSAIGQAIFQPIFAAIGSALGKVFDNLFGESSSVRAQARATRLAFADNAATMEILRQRSLGLNTTLLEAVEANRKYYEGIKAGIDAALPGTRNEAERNAQRAQADRYRADEDERIRRDVAQSRQAAGQSLEERALRAQGRTPEADALALRMRQEQELYDAQRQNMDAAYIARLREVQAIERTAAAMNKLTSSFLNVPPGFKSTYQSLVFQAAASHPFTPGLGGPMSTPYNPNRGGLTPDGKGEIHITIDDLKIVMPNGAVLASLVVRNLKARAQREFGSTLRWGEVSGADGGGLNLPG